MDFHAHIYYTAETRQHALILRALIQQVFGDHLSVYSMVDRLVGPHLLPMFEVEFSESVYDALLDFLEMHRGDLPVLIHPLTDDQIANHGVLARWLGQELPINWSKLSA